MKCPYCGWRVVDNKCIRCMAEVNDESKKIKKPIKEKEK